MNKPIVLRSDCSIEGCRFIQGFKYKTGQQVPLYELTTTGALNQLIGYAKYLNKDYGNVYYRGTDFMYDNIRPSIMRKRVRGEANDLNNLINQIKKDTYLSSSLNLLETIKPHSIEDHRYNKKVERINKYIIEGMLQHYSGITRFADVVNNHWIALWMGLHNFKVQGEGKRYVSCTKRSITIDSIIHSLGINDVRHTIVYDQSKLFVYVILLAMPYSNDSQMMGVSETLELVEVDLRKAIPSFYLRPHAQHALVIRKKDNGEKSHDADYYDMASQAIGMLRVRIDIVDKWLGNGELVTTDNLFPSPSIDLGYNSLLKNKIFLDLKHPNIHIQKYY